MSKQEVKENRLGRYKLESRFHEGSDQPFIAGRDSRIYRASVVSTEGVLGLLPKEVALKVFTPPLLESEKALARFRQEGAIGEKLDHPNIIRFFETGTGTLNGRVVEYHAIELGRENLSQYVHRRANECHRLTPAEALRFGEQIADAIDHAHQKGVVLRDLKPTNFVLSADGKTLKLIDFDSSWLVGGPGGHDRVGFFIFAAPEHFPDISLPSVAYATPASDIFAFGKLLFFLLASDYPRGCDSQPIVQLPDSLSEEPWADEVCRVLHRATRHNPSDRYQTARELVKDFRMALATTENHAEIEVQQESFAPSLSTRRRRRFRRRLAAAAVLAAVLSLFGTCGIVIMNRPSSDAQTRSHEKPCAPGNGLMSLQIVSTTTVNLRARPSPRVRTVCVLGEGSTARLLGEVTNNWALVEILSPKGNGQSTCSAGERGYVYVEYFKIDCQ